MKHTSTITLILVAFFLITQLIGLSMISTEVQQTIIVGENQSVVSINSTLIDEIPAMIFDWKAIIYLIVGITIGTTLILVLKRFSFGGKLWKLWYFLAVYVAINFSLSLLFSMAGMRLIMIPILSTLTALALAFLKVRRYNFYIHNLTEILMYSGMAAFIVLLFNNNVLFVSILLFIIAIYDMIAVWKSKHMVALAEFTIKEKLFPGFAMNYQQVKNKTKIITSQIKLNKKTSLDKQTKKASKKQTKQSPRQAILGGGDVVFPLLFSGVVIGWLFNQGFTRMQSFGLSLIITATTTMALYLLFYYSKKDKFYPAMPFIAAGCYVGFALMYLVIFLLY